MYAACHTHAHTPASNMVSKYRQPLIWAVQVALITFMITLIFQPTPSLDSCYTGNTCPNITVTLALNNVLWINGTANPKDYLMLSMVCLKHLNVVRIDPIACTMYFYESTSPFDRSMLYAVAAFIVSWLFFSLMVTVVFWYTTRKTRYNQVTANAPQPDSPAVAAEELELE